MPPTTGTAYWRIDKFEEGSFIEVKTFRGLIFKDYIYNYPNISVEKVTAWHAYTFMYLLISFIRSA